MMENLTILPVDMDDRPRVGEFMRAHWGGEQMVVHDAVFNPAELPGFIARLGSEMVGLVTYHISGNECELISLDSLREGLGVGAALLERVKQAAITAGCRRMCLTTTNDNLNALRFYQKRGFRLAKLLPGAVERSRAIKPSIPLIGDHGIPLRDELELELYL